ncbi:MAG: acyltransferase [Candidatus Beckwithbacteria bacterium]
MKILKEIGLNRLIKYLIYGLWDFVFQLLPYSPLRVIWLRLGGARIGKHCVIDRVIFFNLDRTSLQGLSLKDNVYLGAGVTLDLAGKIIIKNQATVSANATILSHHSVGYSDHPLLKYYPKKIFTTTIESGSVLGVGSIILPGITIGPESLVAAGSVVRVDVPSHKMVAGVPAVIKKDLK